MHVKASAPAKVILFGEHAVVYGKPAIAVAVKKHANITIKERSDTQINLKLVEMGVHAFLNLEDETVKCQANVETGILKYVLKSLKLIQKSESSNGMDSVGMDITLEIEMPVGAGLGSSAAVTVATLAAANEYYDAGLKLEEIAKLAHQVELEVQGAASPIDTTLSTYGGAIYLEKDASRIEKLDLKWELPLVIGYTPRKDNTAEMVSKVHQRVEKYPYITNLVLDSIEQLTNEARNALLKKDERKLAELMNINHGLLDALGVNTTALSRMVYLTREAGAIGSKITGAGGGGSVIALCPVKIERVIHELRKEENAFQADITYDGVRTNIQE